MRVLILADEFFASRERAMLLRLEVGLADEGVRVIHTVPSGALSEGPMGVFSTTLTYSPKVMRLTRGLAVARLVRALANLDQAEEPNDVDIIHVFGGSVWGFAAKLAERLGSGLVLEVWRSGLVEKARDLRLNGVERPLLLAPDPAIERALLGGDSPEESAMVHLSEWGVLAPTEQREVMSEGKAVSVMMVGTGRDPKSSIAALEGLAAVVRRRSDVLIFCDALAARRARLWHHARRLGILNSFSLIHELEGRRDLLLHGDVLVQPDFSGEQRSIVLEAMAHGMIVVASHDPFISILRDGVTARLVNPLDAEQWQQVFTELLLHPEMARGVAASSQRIVRESRKASDHVRAVLSAYELLAAESAEAGDAQLPA